MNARQIHDQHRIGFGYFPLLGDNAHTADQDYAPCSACNLAMRRGQRIARLPSGDWIHVPCITQTVPA